MTGQTISHYRVFDKLAEGGMGVVYKAEDLNLHRPVALKFLRTDAVNDTHLHGRFWKEAEAAAALDHPNITTVYEIGEADAQTFIAMALIDGESLAAKIKRRPLPLDEALSIASQVAEALQAAHERGIVHRDIKPGNIMITPKAQVKVMDFGLAHLAGQTRITKTGTVMGTPAYMSPEQARGEPLDRRSDIWSLGCVFYEMVTGQLPFRGDSDHALLRAILDDQPEPMTAIRVGTPPELDRILGKAVDKDPDRRYQHADEFAADLKRHQTDSSEAATAPLAPAQARPSRHTLAIAVAAALLLGGALTYLALRFTSPTAAPPRFLFRQLTFEPGLEFQPAISADGKLVAYASDQAGEGNLDIWLQQVAGGEPVRLTTDATNETEPSFSPDGSQIVFRSQRDGGGIFVMSALGGNARFVAKDGRRPRYSPDGKQIAYWTGPEHRPGWVGSQIYVVSADGGEPTRLGLGRSPVWSPDGITLLARVSPESGEQGWYAINTQTADRSLTTAEAEIRQLGLAGDPRILTYPVLPAAWLPDGRVLFSAGAVDGHDVWSIELSSRAGEVLGPPSQWTSGSAQLRHISASTAGSLVASRVLANYDIWTIPVDANRGNTSGPPQRITDSTGPDRIPQITPDGKRIVYRKTMSEQQDIWVALLEAGEQRPLTASNEYDISALITADGESVIHTIESDTGERTAYRSPATGGARKKLCALVAPNDGGTDLTRDGKWMLRRGIRALDLETCDIYELTTGGPNFASNGRFSANDEWITFVAEVQPDLRQIFVIPFSPGDELPMDQWIPITDGSNNDLRVDWSPDGRLIYFASDRDGFRCIYAQPVDPNTKRPAGAPLDVFHSHDARVSIANVPNPGAIGLAVAKDKIAITMAEITGDIWLLEPAEDAAP